MPDKESLQAAMYGPLVLAARFEKEPRENGTASSTRKKQEPGPTLQFKGKLDDPASWLEPADGKLAFRAVAQGQTVTFVPLSSVLHERYFVYHEIQACITRSQECVSEFSLYHVRACPCPDCIGSRHTFYTSAWETIAAF